MERWRKFNEIIGINDSLEIQIAEFYYEAVELLLEEFDEDIDKQLIYDNIKCWLKEEVDAIEKNNNGNRKQRFRKTNRKFGRNSCMRKR